MKNKILIIFVLLITGGLIIMSISNGQTKNKTRILLVGASVGYEWNFPQWPVRMQQNNTACEMVAEYKFDKTQALEEIFMRPKRKFRPTKSYFLGFLKPAPRKPDYLIIKECAAYFPGDLEKYKSLVSLWVKQCLEHNIKPILATVVPVTIEHGQGRPGRLEGILAYNDWVRTYAQNNNIVCFDLEAMLRISADQRSLRPELTSGDGLHLNHDAYRILDNDFLSFIEKTNK